MTAILSSCGRYRYRLERTVTHDTAARVAGTERAVAFLMLNPSTADAAVDDPTIRRCVGYARAWGFDRLIVGNVYALRATNPKALRMAVDPIGPENTHHLEAIVDAAQLVVCAWGTNADRTRAGAVVGLIRAAAQQLHVLGMTKDGHPRHPLYARADLCPAPWGGYADGAGDDARGITDDQIRDLLANGHITLDQFHQATSDLVGRIDIDFQVARRAARVHCAALHKQRHA